MTKKYVKYLTLASSTALAQGFMLLILPVVTRLYGPEDVGAFGVLLGLGALIGSVGTGRLEHAIPVAENSIAAIQVALLGAILVSITSILAMIGVLTIYVMNLLDASSVLMGFPLVAVPVISLSLAFLQLVTALLLRQRAYRSVAMTKLYQGGWTGGLQLVLGWAAFGATGLVWAQALGYLTAGWLGGRAVLPRVRVVVRSYGLHLQATFHRYRRFPLMLAPAALFNQAAQHFPVLALGYIYGLYEAGLYALVIRACGAPLGLLGQAVAQVYASEFRKYIDEHRGVLAQKYLSMLLRLLALGCVVVGVIVLCMYLWGTRLFGVRWANIGTVSLLLSPMLFMDFATTPLSMTLGYLGRERVQLLWDVGRLLLVVGVFAMAQQLKLSHGQVLLLLSTVWAMTLLVHAGLTYFACRSIQPNGID